jgi:hypothetical protein
VGRSCIYALKGPWIQHRLKQPGHCLSVAVARYLEVIAPLYLQHLPLGEHDASAGDRFSPPHGEAADSSPISNSRSGPDGRCDGGRGRCPAWCCPLLPG